MSTKPKIVPIKPQEVLEDDARNNFANYVQSIAFNLTLSRQMVQALARIRDCGAIGDGDDDHRKDDTFDDWANRHPTSARTWLDRNSVTYSQALIRRGLVVSVSRLSSEPYKPLPKQWWQQPSHKLTRAGELCCEMLVEAGIIPPAKAVPKRSRA